MSTTYGPLDLDPDPLRAPDTDAFECSDVFEAGWEEGYRYRPSTGPAIAFGMILGLVVGVLLGIAAAWRG